MSQRALQRVEAFEKRLGQPTLWFAAHAALPLALTPDLAYLLWAQFSEDCAGQPIQAPWIAVADTLLSGFCHEVGDELYEMDIDVRTYLLKRLRAEKRFGEERIAELSRFLLGLVQQDLFSKDSLTRQLARSQRWVALANTEPKLAAEELASELSKTRPENGTELVRLASIIKGEEQLASFPQMLAYADVMAHVGRRRIEQALTAWSELEQKATMNVGSIELRPPAPLRAQITGSSKAWVEPEEAQRPISKQIGKPSRGFSWLHLSDLRISEVGFGRQALLFRDLEALGPRVGGFDLVFLAGDLTATGQASEFRSLQEFTHQLVDLLSRFGRRPLVFPVPGNHDFDRRGQHTDQLNGYFNYSLSWPDDHQVRKEKAPTGKTGGFSISLELGGLSLALLGLNTATGYDRQSTSGEITAELHLPHGERVEDWLRRHDAAILLTHHAPRLLEPRSIRSLETLLSGRGRFWAHLFSHTHERELAGALFDPSRITEARGALHPPEFNIWRSLAAGRGGPNEEQPYCAGRANFEEGATHVELWPRVWEPRAQRFVTNRRVATDESISISMQPARSARSERGRTSEAAFMRSRGARQADGRSSDAALIEAVGAMEPARPTKPRRSDVVLLTSRNDSPQLIGTLVMRLGEFGLRIHPLADPYVGFERAKKVLVLVGTDGDLSPEVDEPLQQLSARGLKYIQRVIPLVLGGKPRRMRGVLSQLPFVGISEAITADEATKVAEALRFRPEDPEKGKWGSAKTRNKRTLDAKVTEVSAGWFHVTLEVRSTDRKRPLTGEVVFHLHPTFPKPRRVEFANDNECTLEFDCYGAFTVGVEADGGETHLELDLSKLRGAPRLFRER